MGFLAGNGTGPRVRTDVLLTRTGVLSTMVWQMELELFKEILEIESTSGCERRLAEFLERRFVEADPSCRCERFEVGDGTLNLLLRWDGGNVAENGLPKVILCSHLDTVPPYVAPEFVEVNAGDVLPDGKVLASNDLLITGRGSCDAKGQFFSMWSACRQLASEGPGDGQDCSRSRKDFGLLLLAGEETGSFGAKAFDRDCPGAEWVIVGEPTDNMMVAASKGTKSFKVDITGKAAHSGYPEQGNSAVAVFLELMSRVRSWEFPKDPVLGKTTWNVGKLVSDNPQNILSPFLTFRIYFRTTFSTDALVQELMASLASENVHVEAFGGDSPMEYRTFDGYGTTMVAFGSDTPRLSKFRNRALCGPGSILVAHTDREYVLASQLELAKRQYVDLVRRILAEDKA